MYVFFSVYVVVEFGKHNERGFCAHTKHMHTIQSILFTICLLIYQICVVFCTLECVKLCGDDVGLICVYFVFVVQEQQQPIYSIEFR